MHPHPTPTAIPRPAPPAAPKTEAPVDRVAVLDQRARAACASRLVIVFGLPRESARLAANDLIDEYVGLMTGRTRC